MQTVKVNLAERSYTVYIGSGMLGYEHPAFDICRGGTVLVVSNETVAPLYLDTLGRSLASADMHSLILPDGEVALNPLRGIQKDSVEGGIVQFRIGVNQLAGFAGEPLP